MFPLISSLLLLACLGRPAAAQEEGTDCSRWIFKNLRLGMSVADVKEQYPTASRVQTDERLGVSGYAYRWQHREQSRMTDYRVIADAETPEATVLLINARIQASGVSPSELQSALLEKWGGIAESEPGVPSAGKTTISGRSVDESCDVRVEFRGSGNEAETNVEITMFSLQARRSWEQRQTEEGDDNKARELLE
jgi:hypothetical protein